MGFKNIPSKTTQDIRNFISRPKAKGRRGQCTRLVLSIDPEIISAQSLESETLCQTDCGSCHPITVDHTDGGGVKGGRYKGSPEIDVLASRDESCTCTAYASRMQGWRHDSLLAGAVYDYGEGCEFEAGQLGHDA